MYRGTLRGVSILMIYRFLLWLKSFFSNYITCRLCGQPGRYDDSAVIKLRCENNVIVDMVICGKCADILEATRIKPNDSNRNMA